MKKHNKILALIVCSVLFSVLYFIHFKIMLIMITAQKEFLFFEYFFSIYFICVICSTAGFIANIHTDEQERGKK